MSNFNELASFLWSVADLLRGDYKQSDYGKIILPFTLLRSLDCVLEPTKIVLSPDNKEFKPMILENVSESDFRVVAEFIGTV